MANTGWEKRDDYYHKWAHGRHALVSHVSANTGWDASIRYADGTTVRAPKYYASAASAKAWADRELERGYRA